jgi:uncharacterized Fe-S radical SAM superfamily protein PflX
MTDFEPAYVKIFRSGLLKNMMLSLQQEGCHNINFVTPFHVVPQVLSAVEIACARGLTIPLVYNSGFAVNYYGFRLKCLVPGPIRFVKYPG